MSDAKKKIDEVAKEDSVVDISVLFNEETTDETKEKIKTVFETAVSAAAKELLEAEVAKRDELVAEAVAAAVTEIEEATDKYLDYVVSTWLEENKIAIESSFKVDMAESLLEGLMTLCSEHNIEIPDNADDVLEGLIAKNDELQAKLNESYRENMSLTEALEAKAIDEIVTKISEGLTDTQASKLKTLAEGIKYSDVNDFEKKLVTVKESFFKEAAPAEKADPISEETKVEQVNEDVVIKTNEFQQKAFDRTDALIQKITAKF